MLNFGVSQLITLSGTSYEPEVILSILRRHIIKRARACSFCEKAQQGGQADPISPRDLLFAASAATSRR